MGFTADHEYAMPQAPRLYPLKLDPIYKERVWGGRSLTRFGRILPGNAQTLIGESWELADLDQPAVTGGGDARSTIADGPLAGCTLHELTKQYGTAITGDLPLAGGGNFPLLVKFLDARENLSVQVHPSPEYAAEHPGAQLKNECWYILAAKPGAVIYKGVRPGITPKEFHNAIDEKNIEQLLIRVEVQPGQMHYLPSGTCHALGGGCLVAEVQTPSDTTFRVYDWGRTERQLHLEQAMQCIRFSPPDVAGNEKNITVEGQNAITTHLVICDHFRIDRIDVGSGFEGNIDSRQPTVWVILSGNGIFDCHKTDEVSFDPGQTLLLPPGMQGGRVRTHEPSQWLQISFPQAESKRIA